MIGIGFALISTVCCLSYFTELFLELIVLSDMLQECTAENIKEHFIIWNIFSSFLFNIVIVILK